jgi:8-oxo-dGTP diphosphatase
MTDGANRFAFCPKCGGRLSAKIVRGRNRSVCNACGYVFYANPIVGVAVILKNQDGSILLGRRSMNSTYSGLWCIPCGYVEYDEEVRSAAKREFLEETGLEVEIKSVFTVLSNFHNPETHTVGIWFLADLLGGSLQAGDDLDAVEWFSPQNPPMLAFPTDYAVLEMLRN